MPQDPGGVLAAAAIAAGADFRGYAPNGAVGAPRVAEWSIARSGENRYRFRRPVLNPPLRWSSLSRFARAGGSFGAPPIQGNSRAY